MDMLWTIIMEDIEKTKKIVNIMVGVDEIHESMIVGLWTCDTHIHF